MTYRIHVPSDTTAKARGADRIARLIEIVAEEHKVDVDVRRNGTRGLYWIEPLVEVETSTGRYGFGPVKEGDIESLFAAEFWKGDVEHALALGLVEEIPYLKRQERFTFSRLGITDPVSLEDYQANDGFKGLENAIKLSSQQIVDQVKESGLRGRGGAAVAPRITSSSMFRSI